MRKREETILVVSRDPHLADVRKTVLEKAAFRVIPALDFRAVSAACKMKTLKLVLIGYSLPPSEKRRVWAEVKKLCQAPILELYTNEQPELVSPVHSHCSLTPDDFLRAT